MAVLRKIEKITRPDDVTKYHYDVMYEWFVVVVKPEELNEDESYENILTVAAPKVAEVEAQLAMTFTSETIEP